MKHLNAVLLLCAVFAGYASADVKTYTSRTAWAAAVSGPTTINFGTAAPVAAGTFTSYQTPPGVTLSGVNFASTRSGGIVSVTSQTFCCSTYLRGSDQLVSNDAHRRGRRSAGQRGLLWHRSGFPGSLSDRFSGPERDRRR